MSCAYRARHDTDRAHLLISEEAANGTERNVTLTFGELYAAAERCAAELARRGVPAGGRVSLMLPTSRAFFCVLRGHSSGRRDSRADLSAVSRRPHRGICSAPIGNSQQRWSLPAADVSPRRRSCRSIARAARENRCVASSTQRKITRRRGQSTPRPPPGALPRKPHRQPRFARASDIALLQYTIGFDGRSEGASR